MDNNNQPAQQLVQQPAPQPAQPAQNVAQAQGSSTQLPNLSSNNSNKLFIFVGIGLVLLALIAGGVYFFLFGGFGGQQAATPTPTTAPQVLKPTSPPAQDNLETDLNSINVDSNTDNDFASIDKELQSL